jgi:hypothetical protein
VNQIQLRLQLRHLPLQLLVVREQSTATITAPTVDTHLLLWRQRR